MVSVQFQWQNENLCKDFSLSVYSKNRVQINLMGRDSVPDFLSHAFAYKYHTSSSLQQMSPQYPKVKYALEQDIESMYLIFATENYED